MNAQARHQMKNLRQADSDFAADETLLRVAEQFSVAITPAMIDLIDDNDPNDPIAAQFLPSVKELQHQSQELADPIGDIARSPIKGIVHRHSDRVLLKPIMACPVYCRFCFRREQIGADGDVLSAPEIDAALDYIKAHSEIWEVILTGGDPLIMSDRRIDDLLSRIRAIDHVKVIRIHSRVPVVDPARITPALAALMRGDKPVTVVLHCNHPRELTVQARAACATLIDAGIPMLSQSVLLRGINDNIETLGALMRGFVENRIKPYYLHHLDLTPGTGHFRVGIAQGQQLMRDLRTHYSGICQPTYVLDVPGGYGKIPLERSSVQPSETGWHVTDFEERVHDYPADEYLINRGDE